MSFAERKAPSRSTLVLAGLLLLALATLQVRQVRRALDATVPGLAAGAVAPALAVADVDGVSLPDSEFGGRPRVVSFWAAWCGPCRKELPEIGIAVEEWNADPGSADDVVFVAVHVGQDTGDLELFLNDPRLRSARFVIDGDGETTTRWSVQALPTTLFVGRDGIVREVTEGYDRFFVDRLKKAFLDESESGGVHDGT